MILKKYKDFVLCIKPAGISSQLTNDNKDNMPLLIAKELKLPTESVYTLHRLDNPVGGTMVYATDKKAAARLSVQIADGTMKKTYLAVVKGVPENPEGIFEDLLFKDSSKNKSFVVKRLRKGVRKASLEYKVIETTKKDGLTYSLVEILLHTGRTHQIRVQFSSRGLPLTGDRRYGSGNDGMPLGLWCSRIEFPDKQAENGVVCEKSVPPTEKYPWCMFNKL